MRRTPEENESLLHREVERAQARRWEPEDDDENQEEGAECDWCGTMVYEDEAEETDTGIYCSSSCKDRNEAEEE
jgi:hypothetical protein